MQCMKCGRDLEAGEIFCQACRENMEKYPVKPGTVVQLPRRWEPATPKKQASRRKPMPVEEQLSLLKRLNRWLALGLVLVTLAGAVLGYFAVTQYLENRGKQTVGQNYTASATVTTKPVIKDDSNKR